MIRPGHYAIVGAAESTEIGTVPNLSSVGLALDGAVNALNDAGLAAADVDGLAVANLPVGNIAQQLGIHPRWVDGTSLGGCSWIYHLRSAIAAINAGYCTTVLFLLPNKLAASRQSRQHRELRAPNQVRRESARHRCGCRSLPD